MSTGQGFDDRSQHVLPVEVALVFLVEEDQNGVEGQAFDSPASFDGAVFWMLGQLQHFQLSLRIVTQTHQSPKRQSQLVRYTTPLEIEEQALYQSAVPLQIYRHFGNKPKPAINGSSDSFWNMRVTTVTVELANKANNHLFSSKHI